MTHAAHTTTLSRDELVRRVQAHYASFWSGNVDDFDDQLAPDFVDEEAPDGRPGPGAVKEHARMMRAGIPDMTVTFDEVVVEGNTVVVHAIWRGTHTGPLFGFAPSGQTVSFQAIVIWRFDDRGRIVRRIAHLDRSAVMAQLA